MEFWKSSKSFNKTDFEALLRAVGYKMPEVGGLKPAGKANRPWEEQPSAEQTRAVLSLLDISGDTSFNRDQNSAIDNWMMHARGYKEWPTDRIEFLRRITRDRRVTFVPSFDQLLSRNPTVAAALMSDVLDRADANGNDGDSNPGYEGVLAMQRIDPAVLTPYAPRILP
ncbi:hypothetical protein AJ88_08025 [Mesorhizobium amorphae CCBAU 01583]|nr:hypothetical protein AJ88_08025 [Mesorhizobium amorphae CCBAU 01583]